MVESGLAFKSAAGPLRERDAAALDARVAGETAELAGHTGIGLRAAGAEAGGLPANPLERK